ncbi:Carrier protein [Hirschfeldia incana]|nr:Carrier protein [Hirschfeldia incana]
MALSFNVRSNSLPSRSHPQAAHVDEQLARLRSSEEASTSSISKRIDNLQELHESLDKLIRLPFTQQALAQVQNKKAVEQLLDGSLRILDYCNVSKDVLSQMKEGLIEIQSILRRKRGDLSVEVRKYLASRKSLKQTFPKIQKSLNVAREGETSLAVFGEAEAITVSLFDSLFSYMSGSKACGKWSVVSRLMSKKKVTAEAQVNEFTRVDSEFQSGKTLKIEDVQILVSCIEDLEDGVESLSKSLIKCRVSILNTLGH